MKSRPTPISAAPGPPAAGVAGVAARLKERFTRGDLLPKSLVCWREGYTRERILRDVLAGVVVGIVALPLAFAFAIASGVEPQRGIFTAVIAGFLIAVLGGSRVQIGGPTGAFVVLVAAIVMKHGYPGLVIATLMAGVLLIAMGLGGLGSLIKFIPYPVVTGFTSGIAVVIFSSQVKDLLGLKMGAVPAEFIDKWRAFAEFAHTFDPATVYVALGALVIVVWLPKIAPKLPSPFVAMLAATLAVQLWHLPVATIGSRFGAIPAMLPLPSLPALSLGQFRELLSPAITIALLAAIESLLSAVVADGMIGTRHRSNMELVAQGVANIGSAIFGGIPATGAIARTATNIKSGGRTPLAGIVHAVTLFLILVFLGRWAALIPLSALAAILVVVAYHMSEWRTFKALLRAPKSDIAVLLLTFGLTVFVDLNVAVQAGVVTAALLFMRRMAEVTQIEGVTEQLRDGREDPAVIERFQDGRLVLEQQIIPNGVEVYEINGPFFFGAAETLKQVLSDITRKPKVFILRMRHVPAIDATGMLALEQIFLRCRKEGAAFILCELREQPKKAIIHAGKSAVFGKHNLIAEFPRALELARKIMAGAGGLPDQAGEKGGSQKLP